MSSTSPYDVFIRLSASDGISGVLAGISHAALDLHGSLNLLQKGFKELHPIAVGYTSVVAGMKLRHLVVDMIDANAELERQKNLFQAAGNSAEDMGRAVKAAYQTAAAVPAMSATESFKLFRELAGATQDNAGSMAVLTQVSKAKRVLEAATGHANDADMLRLFKFVELRQMAIDPNTHRIDPGKFDSEIAWATKALIASQGLITSNDLLMFQKQAGPMGKNISAEDLFNGYLAVMEDMGGARTGTGLTALGRQVFGGIMTPKVMNTWRDYGLLSPDHAGWHTDKKGNTIIDDAAKAITGYGILGKEGGLAFVEKVLRPAMAAHGLKDVEAQNKALYEFGSTETSRRLISMMLMPEQIHLVQQRLKAAMDGAGAYDKLFDGGDWKEAAKAFHGSIDTLKTSLGDAADASPLLMQLAKGISWLGGVVKDHPNIGAVATIGGAIGSGGLVAGGSLTLGIAGWRLIAAASALDRAAIALGAGAAGGNPPGGKKGVTGRLAELGYFASLVGLAFEFGDQIPHPAILDKTPGELFHEMFGAKSGSKMSPVLQEKIADYLSPGGLSYLKGIDDHGFHNGARPGGSSPQIVIPPPPPPNVKVDTKVVLDGRQIAAAVESRISHENRVPNSASGFDGREQWQHPEQGF